MSTINNHSQNTLEAFSRISKCIKLCNQFKGITSKKALYIIPIPCLEGIAGPLKQITLHGDAVVCIHIVLQLCVVIREILENN